jgi:hypothetical protein
MFNGDSNSSHNSVKTPKQVLNCDVLIEEIDTYKRNKKS